MGRPKSACLLNAFSIKKKRGDPFGAPLLFDCFFIALYQFLAKCQGVTRVSGKLYSQFTGPHFGGIDGFLDQWCKAAFVKDSQGGCRCPSFGGNTLAQD